MHLHLLNHLYIHQQSIELAVKTLLYFSESKNKSFVLIKRIY
jgi:hypothetical protein